MEGDVHGNEIGNRYAATLEKCGDDCNARQDCTAFVYSKTDPFGCKLLKQSTPTAPKYGDFNFCRKISRWY